mgnify:CR=1 FL=1
MRRRRSVTTIHMEFIDWLMDNVTPIRVFDLLTEADDPKAKFRVGRKQGRAILYTETGKEYLVFPQGEEQACKEYCDYINKKNEEGKLHL